MHFTFGLLIVIKKNYSDKPLLRRTARFNLNPDFNNLISCGYFGCNIDNWIEFMWWNNEYSLCSRILYCDLWLLLAQRNKYIFLSIRLLRWSEIFIPLGTMFLGVQKFGILFHVWEIRNSEACPVFFGGSKFLNPLLCFCRGSEIFSTLLCSLRDQKVWIVSRQSSWGTSRDKKFRKLFGFLCVAKTLD